jgi:uncharacterized membrane protein YfcA
MLIDLFPTGLLLSVALYLVIVALATSAIHGATGIAGGFLMAAALAPIVGVKPVVPIMTIALLISHSSRTVMNWRQIDWPTYTIVVRIASPCIILGAAIYGLLPARAVAMLLALSIVVTIPLRRWAQGYKIKAGPGLLRVAAAVYGTLAGTSVGPGMILVPFLLGAGLSPPAFVGVIGAIALTSNVLKVAVFGLSNLITPSTVLLGLAIGLVTIPGNWIGRTLLARLTAASHALLVDILTVIGGVNFLWLAVRG